METFRSDNEYEFDNEGDLWYDRILKTIVGSNLVAVLLFTSGIAEGLLVNSTS